MQCCLLTALTEAAAMCGVSAERRLSAACHVTRAAGGVCVSAGTGGDGAVTAAAVCATSPASIGPSGGGDGGASGAGRVGDITNRRRTMRVGEGQPWDSSASAAVTSAHRAYLVGECNGGSCSGGAGGSGVSRTRGDGE